jgi:hypothetical protein
MFFTVASDKLRARMIPLRSPLSRVMPALSIATSVPVPIDTDIGCCQSRRVVHPIISHRNHSAAGLFCATIAAF